MASPPNTQNEGYNRRERRSVLPDRKIGKQKEKPPPPPPGPNRHERRAMTMATSRKTVNRMLQDILHPSRVSAVAIEPGEAGPSDLPSHPLKKVGHDMSAEEVSNRIDGWVSEYANVFGEQPLELPPFRAVNHEINLIDEKLVLKYRMPRCPDELKSQLFEKIQRYTAAQWWFPKKATSAAPMLCVLKKSGKLRTVIDCRLRNDNTVKDLTPFPDQETIREDLARCKYRSKLDLTNAYEQMRIEPDSVKHTAFSTITGTFMSNVLQQGDCNGPSSFQRLMTHLFRDHIGRFCHVYLDDIYIYSNTKEEHDRCNTSHWARN